MPAANFELESISCDLSSCTCTGRTSCTRAYVSVWTRGTVLVRVHARGAGIQIEIRDIDIS